MDLPSFTDPIVLLKRLTGCSTTRSSKSTLTRSSKTNVPPKKVVYSETAYSLAKNGNAGLRWDDPHTCCRCQRVLVCRDALLVHLDSVHLKLKKKFCDLCPKVLFTKAQVRRYMRVHGKMRFECNVCEYKTVDGSHMKRHKQTHAAKVECPTCKKMVASLKTHMEMHAPKKACPICHKLMNKIRVPVHVKIHARRINCKHCNEAFENRNDLRL